MIQGCKHSWPTSPGMKTNALHEYSEGIDRGGRIIGPFERSVQRRQDPNPFRYKIEI